jgi:hypothetical protein
MTKHPKPTLLLPPELKASVEENNKLRAERHNALVVKVFNEVLETITEANDVFVFLESLTAGLTHIYIGANPDDQRRYLAALIDGIIARLATASAPTTLAPGPSSPIN